MATRSRLHTVAICCLLAAGTALADDLYAQVESADGLSSYLFYRTGVPLTAEDAAGRCRAMGGALSSFTSPEQVRQSIWHPSVVEGASQTDTTLLWLGLKVTWPQPTRRLSSSSSSGGSGRRLLGAAGLDLGGAAAGGGGGGDGADAAQVYEQLVWELGSTQHHVPTTTPDGRALPEPLRIMYYIKHHRRDLLQQLGLGGGVASGSTATSSAASRAQGVAGALQAATAHALRRLRGRWDDGDESAVLEGASVEWSDGAGTGLVLAHTANLGFLACNKRSGARDGCCGASFDIGPDPYPGESFPTVFFYPCDSTRSAGAMVPTGYTCRVGATAELPKPSFPSTGPQPGGSPVMVCDPGAAPVTRGENTRCRRCRPGHYSEHGTECVRCPKGTTSKKGAKACS